MRGLLTRTSTTAETSSRRIRVCENQHPYVTLQREADQRAAGTTAPATVKTAVECPSRQSAKGEALKPPVLHLRQARTHCQMVSLRGHQGPRQARALAGAGSMGEAHLPSSMSDLNKYNKWPQWHLWNIDKQRNRVHIKQFRRSLLKFT